MHITKNSTAIFWTLAVILIYAPLFRASNIPLALMLLQLMSIAVLVLLLFGNEAIQALKKSHLILIGLILAVPLVSLIPLPASIWEALPGRNNYTPALDAIAAMEQGFMKTISLAGPTTEYALWTLLPALIVYVATVNLSRKNIYTLVYIVLGMAVFQATLGLMQYGAGPNSPLYFGNTQAYGAAGTWLNRDHYAGFLEMVFPVALALMAATIGIKKNSSRQPSNWRKKLSFMTSVKGNKTTIYACILILIILALIFTRSRAGIGLAMVGLFLSMFVFAHRLGGNNVYGSVGTITAVILVVALEIGLAPVLDRFSMDPLEDTRWTIFGTSMEGVGSFFPLGSGAGTFPSVYPIYQPLDIDHLVNRAHNDYLEWVFDGGILAMIIFAMFLVLYIMGWKRLWISQRWATFRFIQAGAGIGIFLMMIHTAFDFNLHKPANAVFFAFMLAVFFKHNTEEAELIKHARHKKRARTKRMDKDAAMAAVFPEETAEIPSYIETPAESEQR